MSQSNRAARSGRRIKSIPTRIRPNGRSGICVTERIRLRAYSIWEAEGSPENRHEDHWLQAEHEILHEFDILEGDDVPSLAALREAAREHTDTFLVPADLIDADQREAASGMREQP
ncbi:DUF2934 domain-containing protein [Rhizobium sp. BK176]|uniref:DUF2934 domain-containing protein n=1 Tax=Rhizobium sp. BK176 TaxID=2587071 RepID=UPI002A4BC7D4|nr:hypothetical protein [Rhizobium sp. BK176]